VRFTPSIFAKLVEPIKRCQFDRLVERHAGDAYVKSFTSWTHLLALAYAQFSSAVSLRGLEAGWNANRQHHYHLGSGPLSARPRPMPANGDLLRSSPRPSACSQASSIGRRDATARPWRS
jgi:hypothetical protein